MQCTHGVVAGRARVRAVGDDGLQDETLVERERSASIQNARYCCRAVVMTAHKGLVGRAGAARDANVVPALSD